MSELQIERAHLAWDRGRHRERRALPQCAAEQYGVAKPLGDKST